MFGLGDCHWSICLSLEKLSLSVMDPITANHRPTFKMSVLVIKILSREN